MSLYTLDINKKGMRIVTGPTSVNPFDTTFYTLLSSCLASSGLVVQAYGAKHLGDSHPSVNSDTVSGLTLENMWTGPK